MRVALVQARPHLLDLEASLAKAESLIAEAASDGARLVAFGETWLCGYPAWLDITPGIARWGEDAMKEVHARLRSQSLVIGSEAEARLSAAARSHGVVLVMGAHERVEAGPGNHTLYNALLIYDSDGRRAVHHRKLVPTYTERLHWGPGDAAQLEAATTSVGRVGGLVCWEHWMPMARQVLHDSGEAIHVAQWPTVHEMHAVASRHYAFEGRCHVLAVGSLLQHRDLPEALRVSDLADDHWLLEGGSRVFAPDGRPLTDPVFREETTIHAELDLAEGDRESATLDVSGHYARPDVFELTVTRKRR